MAVLRYDRVSKEIRNKLDELLDNHCWISPMQLADRVLYPYEREIPDRVYHIFGEFLLFRLMKAAEASQEFCDRIIKAPGMAWNCREVALEAMQPWVVELMAKFNESMAIGDKGQLVKDYFDSFGFVRTPDPTPEEIARQNAMLKDILKGL